MPSVSLLACTILVEVIKEKTAYELTVVQAHEILLCIRDEHGFSLVNTHILEPHRCNAGVWVDPALKIFCVLAVGHPDAHEGVDPEDGFIINWFDGEVGTTPHEGPKPLTDANELTTDEPLSDVEFLAWKKAMDRPEPNPKDST